ncbi:unnamed protein product [Rhodiola kirilowii]
MPNLHTSISHLNPSTFNTLGCSSPNSPSFSASLPLQGPLFFQLLVQLPPCCITHQDACVEACLERKVVRRFVPTGKLLQPVLNECVTTVTCYWSLSTVIHGEEELLLVFKELRPPVKMLVPVWKALCASIKSCNQQDDCAKSPSV